MGLRGFDRPPLAGLTIRFGHYDWVDVHYQPHDRGLLAIHATGYRQPDRHAGHGSPLHRLGTAEVVTLTRVSFLTNTGRRGAAAGTILDRGVDLDSAVAVADALDLLAGAALAVAGITEPDDARSVMAAMWASR